MGASEPFSVAASDHEIVTLVFALAAVLFTIWKRRALRALPRGELLMVPAGLLVLSWLATVVEGFAAPVLFNIIEHTAMLGACIALGAWAILLPREGADA